MSFFLGENFFELDVVERVGKRVRVSILDSLGPKPLHD